jgi:hypothetical protein
MLTSDLEIRDVGVQVDAIKALEVELHVTVEEISDTDDVPHRRTPFEGRLGPLSTTRSVSGSPTVVARRSEAGLTERVLSNADR